MRAHCLRILTPIENALMKCHDLKIQTQCLHFVYFSPIILAATLKNNVFNVLL